MMEIAKFDSATLSILAEQKGKKLQSYECGSGELMFGRAYGNVRLNFESCALELENTQKPFIVLGEPDDIAFLTCSSIELSSAFQPYVDEDTCSLPIDAIVTDVAIVEETVELNQGAFKAVFDNALIVYTDKGAYMFSRGWHYSELIFISCDDNYDAVYPVSQDTEAWSNDGEEIVSISRRKIFL